MLGWCVSQIYHLLMIRGLCGYTPGPMGLELYPLIPQCVGNRQGNL